MQEELVRSTTFRYITDVITRDEALEMLKANESDKKERERKVRDIGYPAYVTSAGWLGTTLPSYSNHKNKIHGPNFMAPNHSIPR